MRTNFNQSADLSKLQAYSKFHRARWRSIIAKFVSWGYPDEPGHATIRAAIKAHPFGAEKYMNSLLPYDLNSNNAPSLK